MKQQKGIAHITNTRGLFEVTNNNRLKVPKIINPSTTYSFGIAIKKLNSIRYDYLVNKKYDKNISNLNIYKCLWCSAFMKIETALSLANKSGSFIYNYCPNCGIKFEKIYTIATSERFRKRNIVDETILTRQPSSLHSRKLAKLVSSATDKPAYDYLLCLIIRRGCLLLEQGMLTPYFSSDSCFGFYDKAKLLNADLRESLAGLDHNSILDPNKAVLTLLLADASPVSNKVKFEELSVVPFILARRIDKIYIAKKSATKYFTGNIEEICSSYFSQYYRKDDPTRQIINCSFPFCDLNYLSHFIYKQEINCIYRGEVYLGSYDGNKLWRE